MDSLETMSQSIRELYDLRKAKGLVPYDVRGYLGVPPGVDAPLSIIDHIVAEVRARSDAFGAETFMGEVDGEEL